MTIRRGAYTCAVTKTWMLDEERRRAAYGIAVSGGGRAAWVRDVSADWRVVSVMARKLWRARVSPLHLRETLEDLIS